jgi:hypothetical protein
MENSVTETKRLPSQILDNLYLGGIFDSQRKDILLSIGIKYILIVGSNMFPNFPKDFYYKRIDIADEPFEQIDKYFEDSYK